MHPSSRRDHAVVAAARHEHARGPRRGVRAGRDAAPGVGGAAGARARGRRGRPHDRDLRRELCRGAPLDGAL